jgi:hypothetical protein
VRATRAKSETTTPPASCNDLFINPLMSQYWAFGVSHVACCMAYAGKFAENERNRRCQKSDRILQGDGRIAASSADTALA